MGLIDILAGKAMGLDIPHIAKKAGLPHDTVDAVLVALAHAHGNGDKDIVATASQQTDIPRDKVQDVLTDLGGPDALVKVAGLVSGGGREDAIGNDD